MNLTSTQIKDTYGNLLTIGSAPGTPTTGAIQNGAGTTITALTMTNTTLEGGLVVNESSADVDFRVEGLSDPNLLFVDASTDRVGIGTATPASLLDVDGDLTITDKIIHSGDTNTSIRFPSADTVTVETAGTERLNIGSTGDFAFKATNTATTYTFGGIDTEANHQISLFAGRRTITDGKFTIYCQLGHSSGATRPQANIEFEAVANGASDINFSTSATGPLVERMTITSNGYLRMASGTGGIQFGGDTAAANALDDYEEGTWTPVYAPSTGSFTSLTMDVISATYTKIGNTVHLFGFIRTDAVDTTGASGNLTITGLPFTSSITSTASCGNQAGWTTNNPTFIDLITTSLFLRRSDGSGAALSSIGVTNMTNAADSNRISFAVSYQV